MATETKEQSKAVEESTDEKLEKQYQETGHVPSGYRRKYVTARGETKPVYTKIEKAK